MKTSPADKNQCRTCNLATKGVYCSIKCKASAQSGEREPLQDRVFRNVRKTEGCWFWDGLKNNLGYGRIRVKGRTVKAHRVMFELTHNVTLTPEQVIRHSCDTPSCVNPAHLLIGSQLDNIADMRERKRHAHGETSYAKLTTDQVKEIRGDSRSQTAIAQQYDICQQTVSDIKSKRIWSHV